MQVIIYNSFVLLLASALITYNMRFCAENNINMHKQSKYLIMGLTVVIDAFLYILMEFCFGTIVCYLLFTIDRFARVLFMTELFLVSCEFGCISERFASVFVSFMSYSAAVLFFVDTLISGGKLMNGPFGVYYIPIQPVYKLLYYILYFAYFLVFLVQIVYKFTIATKKREKSEFLYSFLAIFFCILNQCVDLIVLTLKNGNHFSHAVFEIISLYFIYKEIYYHRSISLERQDYSDILSPQNCEVAFVMDDNYNIVFCSRRAEIVSEILEDEYIGRNFFDVFHLPEETKQEILDNISEEYMETYAEYGKNEWGVNLSIKNSVDKFGDIISAIVRVSGMEPQEMTAVVNKQM